MNSDKDAKRFTDISLTTAAIVAGLGLLVMAGLAPFADFGIFQNLVVSGDAKTTAENIMASGGLFRIGICCFLVVAILDVVVAWALYVLLKSVNKSLSLLAAWFRIVYAVIFAISLNNLCSVLNLLTGANYLKVFEANQLHAQVMLFLSAFRDGWNIGFVIFGFHLIILGYLVFKSGFIPRLLGLLLVVAGLGYLIDSLGKLLLSNYNISIAQFTFIGELLLIFWLLWRAIKGFDQKQKKKS